MDATAAHPQRKLEEPQLVGGYTAVPDFETHDHVIAAADFTFEAVMAPDSTYTLSGVKTKDIAGYEVTGASEQVVAAGINIQLADITFVDSSGECVGAANVVVYDELGDMNMTSITSFDDTGCPVPIELAGGYSSVPDFETDDEVMAAANFTFEELMAVNSTLDLSGEDIVGYEVTGASTQVVAGLNIRLDMIFVDSSGDCVAGATVVVYDEFGDMSIAKWHETGCGETHDEGLAESAAYCNPTGSLFALIKMMPLMLLLK